MVEEISLEDIFTKIDRGELKLHELDKLFNDSNKATEVRRRYIESRVNVKLDNVGKTVIDFNTVVGRNIENTIGAAQVPIGIAGAIEGNRRLCQRSLLHTTGDHGGRIGGLCE